MDVFWDDISYLKGGNKRQRAAFKVLTKLKIMDILGDYNPTLVGTIPIEVDISGSDLDIICETNNIPSFMEHVSHHFRHHDGFHFEQKNIKGLLSAICNFSYGNFPIQIFAQPKPVEEQHAYLHMVIESRLLFFGGDTARRKIRKLKKGGLKTEPAFAAYFRLEGDPYKTLLDLAHCSDESLEKRLHNFSTHSRK